MTLMIAAVADLLYLSRADVERVLDVDAMLDALADALVAFSGGHASVPPRTAVRVAERGLLGVMPGYIAGVALESKLVSVFPANHEQGIPSHQGLIALFNEKNGSPVAVMDGTYITAIARVARRRSRLVSSPERTPQCWRSSAPACRAGRTSKRSRASATS